jgi:hypothetical protein
LVREAGVGAGADTPVQDVDEIEADGLTRRRGLRAAPHLHRRAEEAKARLDDPAEPYFLSRFASRPYRQTLPARLRKKPHLREKGAASRKLKAASRAEGRARAQIDDRARCGGAFARGRGIGGEDK